MREENMANDMPVNFKTSAAMVKELGAVSFEIDEPKSEIIRTCIALGLDTIRNNPGLCHHVRFEDRKSIKQG